MNKNANRFSARFGALLTGLLLTVVGLAGASAQDRTGARGGQALTASIEGLRLNAPITVQTARGVPRDGVLHRSLAGTTGSQQVIIRLSSKAAGKLAAGDPAGSLGHKLRIDSEQAGFLRRSGRLAPNMKVIARTQIVLNAVFVEVDAALLPELAKDPDVLRISPVANYELDLTDTVPYIGGTAVQGQGYDGTGIRVAVLDSGIDYTHANMGGPGTLEAYEDAWGVGLGDPRQTMRDGLFPTDKVVDGYDFVGEFWPDFGPLAPDEDPIDIEGHGSHVADIIGGANGVAPGVDLYAVKVCSAVSSSCSGVALIQGMEFAVDPNGDGKTNDRVDVINMSLGSLYGQPFDDDLAQAVENASEIGVLTVASAGNSADKPYITGTPAAAPSALSVAQTQVPSAALQLIDVDAASYPAVFQPWSAPLATTLTGPVVYGDGAGGNLDGCVPFESSLAGNVVLVDRGGCTFTSKIVNIGDAGGTAGIIGLVAPGAPFAGGGTPASVPGFMISQADSDAIKSQIGGPGIVSLDPLNQLPLVGQMVASSSRGPSNQVQQIKPEIGAPGASVSMIAGLGTAESPFGGTSGAAPMVAGAAALLLDASCETDRKKKSNKCPEPAATKARLINTGETEIFIDPLQGLAEITRIGGGEVRVDRALQTRAAAWEKKTGQGALSFGFIDVADDVIELKKKVVVQGIVDEDRKSDPDSEKQVTYTITPTFRYASDQASGAVSVSVNKDQIKIKGKSKKEIKVRMTIDGALLPGNFMNSGSQGGDGSALTANEFDGYLLFEGDNGESFHMPWQVLPRKAASIKAPKKFDVGGETVSLVNKGVGTAQIDGYALLATSPNLKEGKAGEQSPTPDIRAVGVNTFPIAPGFELFPGAPCEFVWAFAINTWERQSHLVPVAHQLNLDTDRDGDIDYFVYNFPAGFDFGDGRNVTWAENADTGDATAYFFAEHATNTGNTVLLVCGNQIGLGWNDVAFLGGPGTTVDMSVSTFDVYFGGPGDFVGGLSVTPFGERFVPILSDINGNDSGLADLLDFGPFPGNSDELGVLLITNGDRGDGAHGGATEKTEATVILAD